MSESSFYRYVVNQMERGDRDKLHKALLLLRDNPKVLKNDLDAILPQLCILYNKSRGGFLKPQKDDVDGIMARMRKKFAAQIQALPSAAEV